MINEKKQILMLQKAIKDRSKTYEKACKNLTSTNSPWCKPIRIAYQIPVDKIAKKMKVTSPRIHQIEKAEEEGNVKIRTLQEMANALGYKLIYAFIPKE